MAEHRIASHPILSAQTRPNVTFTWQGQEIAALEGETIASALFANGVRVFGHHPKDGSPQGIFCANGQCAQCLVLADGMPVKSCMEPVRPGLRVEPVDALPELPKVDVPPPMAEIEVLKVPVLIIGGGPAGMSAAIQLGERGIKCLLVDDKDRLGGKLVLQTHRFFGSINAVYAGTRGIDIATKLENQVRAQPDVEIWLNSTALAVFSDRKVGILQGGDRYVLIEPEVLLVAAGAREGPFLERQGHVEPPAARGREVAHRAVERLGRLGRHEQPLVTDRLPGLAREGRVDLRGATVADGIAHHQVAVRHGDAHLATDRVFSASLVKVQVRTICRMSPSLRISSVKGAYGAPA